MNGRAWVFRGGITTEDILPNEFLDRANDEVGQFAMAGIDPNFAKNISAGDVVVGDANFGSGSSRETAPIALKLAGIGVVVAESFGRVFLRNCINIGLPALVIESTAAIHPGDELSIDMAARIIKNSRSHEAYSIQNLSGISLEILNAGGIVPYTKQRKNL